LNTDTKSYVSLFFSWFVCVYTQFPKQCNERQKTVARFHADTFLMSFCLFPSVCVHAQFPKQCNGQRKLLYAYTQAFEFGVHAHMLSLALNVAIFTNHVPVPVDEESLWCWLKCTLAATHCTHAATHCTALQHTALHCSTLHCTALHCNAMQHTTAHHTAICCTTLQHACSRLKSCGNAVTIHTLQHIATHCNTL